MSGKQYFNVVCKGSFGVGGFGSLDEARRYCAGEEFGFTPPLTQDPLRIEEWVQKEDRSWYRAHTHLLEAGTDGSAG